MTPKEKRKAKDIADLLQGKKQDSLASVLASLAKPLSDMVEKPDHEWNGTKLKFETSKGEWGKEVDLKGEKGDKGDKANDPTKDELLSLIKPLIPEPIKGDNGYTPVKGKDYFDGEDGYTPVKGKDYFDGADGKNTDDNLIIKKVLSKLDIPTADKIVEIIVKKKLLKVSNLKDYEQFIFAGKKYKISELMHGGGGVGTTGGTPIDNEVVAGDTNTFTLANTPILGSEHLFGLGQRLTLTVDYSITGAVITTVNPWSSGQIIADYKK